MIATFIAFVLALVVGPIVQVVLAWLLVETLFMVGGWIARRIGRRVLRRWREFRAYVRRARFFVVTPSYI